jgi:cache domain-containing protein
MARKRYELDSRVLTVFFFVAMPFVAFGSFIVVSMARGALQASLGESFEQRATETKLLLERYIGDQIVHLRLVSLETQVHQVLAAPVHELSADETRRLEDAWGSGDKAVTDSLVGSPLANRLRETTEVRPALRLLQVIDSTGRVVASTGRAGRVIYAEMPWFKKMRDDTLEREPFVGDVQAGATGTLPYLGIACPVRDPTDGRLLGVVRAAIDFADLYGILAPVRIGRTGHAVLLRSSDGIVLVADETEHRLGQPYPGFNSLEAAIQGFPLGEQGEKLFGSARRQRGYWTLPEVRAKDEKGKEVRLEPPRLVGYAPVDQVPNVQWVVVVEQDLGEALAPIQGVTRYLWIHFIGAFGTVILLALYLSFRSETPIIEEELHLHEEHVPKGVSATES